MYLIDDGHRYLTIFNRQALSSLTLSLATWWPFCFGYGHNLFQDNLFSLYQLMAFNVYIGNKVCARLLVPRRRTILFIDGEELYTTMS